MHVMRMVLGGMGAAALLAGAAVSGATAPQGPPAPVRYKNCAALNRAYPHGVGRKGAVDKVAGSARKAGPVRNFRVDNRLYAAQPKTLDRDKDGIACEKH